MKRAKCLNLARWEIIVVKCKDFFKWEEQRFSRDQNKQIKLYDGRFIRGVWRRGQDSTFQAGESYAKAILKLTSDIHE